MPKEQSRCRLIEIPQAIAGFNRFIGSWFFQGAVNLIVDVGPAHSVAHLLDRLVNLGVKRVDFILLTHIHIDHAGGLAKCLEHFPMARVVCHEKAIEHLADPERLWDGSKKVLGKIAEAFGRPEPIKEEKCIGHKEACIENLAIIDTPGHAAHHLSFSYGGQLFAGEAAGNYYAMKDMDYLRPATPPRFIFDLFLRTLERLRALEDMPVCYAHWGRAKSSHRMLDRFRTQVMMWKDVIQEEALSTQGELVTRCAQRLLAEDPNLKAFQSMNATVQARELFFLSNSVKGYIGFLNRTS